VIEKDVDGPNSLPRRMDAEIPNLGKLSACRRVARTIYLGSAPISAAAHRGLEDRQVKLGCVMPGESPMVLDDALRRLAGAATYLYRDGPRYWYSTQPTVTKLAEDRAEQLKREPDNHEAFPDDMRVDIDELVVAGDTVVLRLTLRGTDRGGYTGRPPTGQAVEEWAVNIMHFEADRVVSEFMGADKLGLFVQLGVIENPWPAAALSR